MRAEANRHIYGLESDPFQALGAWLGTFQLAMVSRFDNLDAYLRAPKSHPND